jgi:hypothetical protein
MADTSSEDDHFLALVESNQKKINKLPSGTIISESSENEEGDETRREVCIGEEVAAVSDLILALETEVNQLWDAWEAADRHVQTKLAEMNGGTDLSARRNGFAKDIWKSMAEDMEAFGTEAKGIIEDSHEEARACEKVCFNPLGVKSLGIRSHSVGIWQEYLRCDVRPLAAVSVGRLREGGDMPESPYLSMFGA